MNTPCPITHDDKHWVEENFDWLITTFGYPGSNTTQVLPNRTFFPRTFSNKKLQVDAVIGDLCHLLALDPQKISFELEKDIRDTHDLPYQFVDAPFETEVAIIENEGAPTTYRLFIANYLLQHPDLLVFNLTLNLVHVCLLESEVPFETEGDTDLFIYLAAIYFGFGVIMAQNLVSQGVRQEGAWQTKWNYRAAVPAPVVAYAMALYESLMARPVPDWNEFLPADFVKAYDKAADFVRENRSSLFNQQEKNSVDLVYLAGQEYLKNDFEAANMTLQKASFLTHDKILQAEIENSIGYNYVRMQQYEKSIPHFQKAIEFDPFCLFAHNNLGLAFIMTGDLLSGKHYLDIAPKTALEDEAYGYRNLALYHQYRGDARAAEDYFQRALSTGSSVDLLEYFYAKFLLATGRKEEGMDCLRMAVDRNEPEAILLMKELTNE